MRDVGVDGNLSARCCPSRRVQRALLGGAPRIGPLRVLADSDQSA
ncbi:hypothetical protein [Streptomyces fructofermentans]